MFFSEGLIIHTIFVFLPTKIQKLYKNGNYCDCNRKNAMKFGGFKKK